MVPDRGAAEDEITGTEGLWSAAVGFVTLHGLP